MTETFRSWGGLAARDSTSVSPESWRNGGGPLLAYGNGRSYGDSCLLDQGGLIQARENAKLLSLDRTSGLMVAEAGLLLSELINAVLPQGWFPPVVPGTRFVSLGGALANDVHGKNHHKLGTFGCHVPWFDIERSDGQMLRCSPDENAALYAATIGGLGLTGFVRRLALQLIPVRSAMIDQETLPFDTLDRFFQLAAQSDRSHAYSVAWIDSAASGSRLGRGVYFRGNHAVTGPLEQHAGKPVLNVPFTPPFSLLNRLSLGMFNQAYRFSHRSPKRGPVPYGGFFFPLDRIGNWNRIYGPKGLRQFQCVVPLRNARFTIAALLEETHRAKAVSFLTVLKLFGDRISPGLMSFPMQGATLTLDFPYLGSRTDRLLDRLEGITMEAGGRINPYKDAHMSSASFRSGFPNLDAFRAELDPRFASTFWRRMGMG